MRWKVNKMLVRSNEEFEAIRFIGQKEIFGSPVVRKNKTFEYSIQLSYLNIGLDMGDWVLRSTSNSDMYNSERYFSIPDKYFHQMYEEVRSC